MKRDTFFQTLIHFHGVISEHVTAMCYLQVLIKEV